MNKHVFISYCHAEEKVIRDVVIGIAGHGLTRMGCH